MGEKSRETAGKASRGLPSQNLCNVQYTMYNVHALYIITCGCGASSLASGTVYP